MSPNEEMGSLLIKVREVQGWEINEKVEVCRTSSL